MAKLRVGIIGVGGSVAALHHEACRQLESIDIVAGADIDRTALEAVSHQWGIKGYISYEEMLGEERLDIACICVPARYHKEVAARVAEKKVHILIEKPLATSLEEGQAIIDSCDRNGVKLYYGASYRTLSANIKAREMIRNGDLGEISMVMETVIGGNGLESYAECGPQHYPPGTPGGCGMGIMDHGIHLIDLFCWYLDTEVHSVFGRGNISGEAPVSEHMTVTFKNGTVAHLLANTISYSTQLPSEGTISWGGSWDPAGNFTSKPGWASHPANFQVYGSKGALKVCPYAEQLTFFSGGGITPIYLEHRPMPANFATQMASFADSIVHEKPPAVTGDDGMRSLKIVLAAYESAEKQRLIFL